MKIERRTVVLITAAVATISAAAILVPMAGAATAPRFSYELVAPNVPQNAPAPGYSPMSFTVGTSYIDPNITTIVPNELTTAAELKAYLLDQPEFNHEQLNIMAFTSSFPYYTVLQGDNVSFIGAIWLTQAARDGVIPPGVYTPAPAGNWVPDSQYLKVAGGNVVKDIAPGVQGTAYTLDKTSYWPGYSTDPLWAGGYCDARDAVPSPQEPTTLWYAWCMGAPGVFTLTLPGITAPRDAGQSLLPAGSPPGRSWAVKFDGGPGIALFSSPQNQITGYNPATYGSVGVLNPQLQVTKEVCVTGNGCDVNDNNQWVKATAMPSMTGTVQWRITATNSGNADLTNVHVARDTFGFTNTLDQAKVSATDCQTVNGATGFDLKAGASNSWTCTSEVETALVGALVNGVSLNGTVVNIGSYMDPPDVPHPNGISLSDRLQANPDDNQTIAPKSGVIGSNTDTARVTPPVPGVKETKWACGQYDAANQPNCTDPTTNAAVLQKLAGIGVQNPDGTWAVTEGQPAGGWQKQTTIPATHDAKWIVVVTNTGNTSLTNYAPKDNLTAPAGSYTDGGTLTEVNPPPGGILGSGQSAVFVMTTTGVKNTNLPSVSPAGDAATGPYQAQGESSYTVQTTSPTDVVNQVTLTGVAVVEPNGTPILENGQPAHVDGNPSWAEVNTILYGIGDYVWVDLNWNGVQDPGEPGLEGVNVSVRDAAGNVVANVDGTRMQMFTDSNGYYYFDGLLPGTYRIEFAWPVLKDNVLYDWTTPNVGGVATDSDALVPELGNNDKNDRMSAPVTLGPGAPNLVRAGDPSLPAVEAGTVKANWINPTIDAGVVQLTPGLKLTKWVCGTYVGTTPNCTDPMALTPADVAKLGGVAATRAADHTYPATLGLPTGGWVKQATIPVGATAQWLVVVSNPGSAVMQVNMTDVTDAAPSGTYGGWSQLTLVKGGTMLAPGASALYMATTTNVTDTDPWGTGPDKILSVMWQEPVTFTAGNDVVNAASAQGAAFTLPYVYQGTTYAPTEFLDWYTGRPHALFPTNTSFAEANTSMYGVGDYVWLDTNHDGIQNNGETGVPGIKVTLLNSAGATVATTTTNADGYYYFDKLAPGNYQVQFDMPTGLYDWTTPNATGSTPAGDSDAAIQVAATANRRSAVFTLGPGAPNMVPYNDPSVPVGEYTPTVSWVNTTIDAGLVPLNPGVKQTKWVCTQFDATTKAPACADLTDPANAAILTSMAGIGAQQADGTWAVTEGTAPAGSGWTRQGTLPSGYAAQWLVIVTNTGNTSLTGYTPTELSLAGVTGGKPTLHELTSETGNVLVSGASAIYTATTTNITNGNDYVVTSDNNAGGQAQGESTYTVGAGPSDVVNQVALTGVKVVHQDGTPVKQDATTQVTIGGNQSWAEVNTQVYGVGDYVWFDDNGNGIQEANEPPAAGVTIELLNATGQVLATTVTNQDGYYLFDNLPAGTYQMQFDLPNGLVDWTVPDVAGSTDFNNSDAVTPVAGTPNDRSARFTLGPSEPDMLVATDPTLPLNEYGTVAAQLINPALDAGLVQLTPGVKLTKWACGTYSGLTPSCTAPTALTPANLATLSGVTLVNGVPHVAQGQPAGGWVHQATIPSGAVGQWLVVVTNTGNSMIVVNASDIQDAGPTGTFGTWSGLSLVSGSNLLTPGASALFFGTVTGAADTGALGAGPSGTLDGVSQEPVSFGAGNDVVNTATATVTVYHNDGKTPVTNGTTPVKVTSNPSTAELVASPHPVVNPPAQNPPAKHPTTASTGGQIAAGIGSALAGAIVLILGGGLMIARIKRGGLARQ